MHLGPSMTESLGLDCQEVALLEGQLHSWCRLGLTFINRVQFKKQVKTYCICGACAKISCLGSVFLLNELNVYCYGVMSLCCV